MSSSSTEANETPLSAVPEPGEGERAAPPPVHAPEGDGEERSSWLFLAALIALVLLAVGLVVQSQRIEGFEEQVAGLEGQVTALEGEVEAAEARVERFELEREQIRLQVGTLRENVLALEALVGPAAAPAPGPAEP